MEVFCLASGPSLTAEDVALVRQWRTGDRQVFVTNNTHELVPWADVLFAGDGKWLDCYAARLKFDGERVTASVKGHALGWTVLPSGFRWHQNSGVGAIAWAIHRGAKRINLLGYDCQKSGGKTHWHGSHSAKLKDGRVLKDATNMAEWPIAFVQVANTARALGVEVVNCSRQTALKCFPRATLESVAEPASVAA